VIPEAAITHWRNVAPWPQDVQVEQDLILSRALVEIFLEPSLSDALLLRGGTALHKLFVSPPRRYSEDIDLVQVAAGRIGPILNAIRTRLDPLFGEPRREMNPGNVTLRYRMESEIPPVVPLRLKLEINTREHFVVFGVVTRRHRSRAVFEKNLAAKVDSRAFNDDLRPLLAPAVRYDVPAAARAVSEQLLALL